MTSLSPAAQAVLDAAFRVYNEEEHLYVATTEKHAGMITAAALRAAVDAVAPEEIIEDLDYVHQSYVEGYMDALYEILIVVNELESQ